MANRTSAEVWATAMPERSKAAWEEFKAGTDQDVERLTAGQAFFFGHMSGCIDEYKRAIPCTESMPAIGQRVLIFTDNRWGVDVGGWQVARLSENYLNPEPYSCNDGWIAIGGPCHWNLDQVTHWMPLPESPV